MKHKQIIKELGGQVIGPTVSSPEEANLNAGEPALTSPAKTAYEALSVLSDEPMMESINLNAGKSILSQTKKEVSDELAQHLLLIHEPLQKIIGYKAGISCYKPNKKLDNLSLDQEKFHLFIAWPKSIPGLQKAELIRSLACEIMQQELDHILEAHLEPLTNNDLLSNKKFDKDYRDNNIAITEEILKEISTNPVTHQTMEHS